MPPKPTGSMDMHAAWVLAESAFYTGTGIERAMAGKEYYLDDAARAYWLHKHADSIPKALRLPAADWDQDRQVVIPQAVKLGELAAKYAIEDSKGHTPIRVDEKHLEKASIEVNASKECRAPRIHPERGKGAYCEIKQ